MFCFFQNFQLTVLFLNTKCKKDRPPICRHLFTRHVILLRTDLRSREFGSIKDSRGKNATYVIKLQRLSGLFFFVK